MIVVILAAGKGSRLLHPEIPKPLTELCNQKSILQMQLEAFTRIEGVKRISVVIGYEQEKFRERYPHLNFVINSSYATENTAKSLLRAIKGVDEDLLWANGDVVFHPTSLKGLLAASHSAMLVNEAPVAHEEVKYRADKSGRILAVSKQVMSADGEALGINVFKQRDLALLVEGLQKCRDSDYFEKGIEYCIAQGLFIEKSVIPQDHCIEIDFPEDVERANALLRSWPMI